MPPTTTRTQRGKKKLCLNGFSYVIKRENKSNVRWRCSKYTSFTCPAALITTSDGGNPELIGSHNHASDRRGIIATKRYAKMKKRAADSLAKPGQIYAEEAAKMTRTTLALLPSEESVKRTLRNQGKAFPKNPQTLQELIIPDNLKTIGDEKDRFLLHDNGPDADERIIVFATDEFLELLSESSAWYMDGNHSLAPTLFMQLYVIRVPKNNFFVTVVYCLLQRKTLSTYEKLFQVLVDACAERGLQLSPETVNMDFEKPVIDALTMVLGNDIIIRGCFYHLSQSTWRKIQELGLATAYREDEKLNRFCGMIDALAFLPKQDVERGMTYLKNHDDVALCGDLVSYFDKTYVSGTHRRIGRLRGSKTKYRQIPPLFPPETWNVHETTLAGDERTNNQTEGWNNRFSNLVGQKHPTVWKLIHKMKLEVAVDCGKIERFNYEPAKKKRRIPAYQILQCRLKAFCEEYVAGKRDIAGLLKVISNNIRLRAKD